MGGDKSVTSGFWGVRVSMLFLHLLLLGNYLVLVSCSFVFVVLHCGEYWCKWQVPI